MNMLHTYDYLLYFQYVHYDDDDDELSEEILACRHFEKAGPSPPRYRWTWTC